MQVKRDAGFLKAQLAEHKEELSVARMEVERLQRELKGHVTPYLTPHSHIQVERLQRELKEQAAMLSREHQHNQNDLSQRISAAEERESNQGSPLPNRTPRPPAAGSGLRPRSAETADADAAAATAADAATPAAAAASAVTTPRLIELASPRLGDAIADEPSSQALRVRALEAEVAYLKGKNRILRQHSVLQKVIEIRRMDALETLKATLDETKAKLDAKEQQLHERDQTIRELRASGARLIDSPTTPRLPLGASAPLVRKGDTAAFAAVAKKRISVLHGSGGGGRSPTRNRHSAPTPGSSGAPISEAAAEYKRFHALATSRKLALASRGYEVENIFIDDLFDDAQRQNVPPEEWHAYLRDQIPDPSAAEEQVAESFRRTGKRTSLIGGALPLENDEDGEGRDAVPAMSATWPRAGNGKEPRKGALLRKLDSIFGSNPNSPEPARWSTDAQEGGAAALLARRDAPGLAEYKRFGLTAQLGRLRRGGGRGAVGGAAVLVAAAAPPVVARSVRERRAGLVGQGGRGGGRRIGPDMGRREE